MPKMNVVIHVSYLSFNFQECEQELTQKGEMVTRLQAKTSQIGQILNNLEKYNHLLKDAEKGGHTSAKGNQPKK